MSREVLVLGAGIVGVATALTLQAGGAQVVLADSAGPQEAASFGNAGILQAEAVEPYPMPRAPAMLLRLLTRRDPSFDWDLRGLVANAPALLQYWRNSAPDRHRRVTQVHAWLIEQAVADHEALAELAGAEALLRRTGFVAISTENRTAEAYARHAEHLASAHGIAARVVDPAGVRALEPGLTLASGGGVFWPEPVSLPDPAALTAAYAHAFRTRGGVQVTADAKALARDGSGWRLPTAEGPQTAEHVVLALGAATPALARRLGHRFPLVPKRGYHVHMDAADALSRPVVDFGNGFVMAPMSAGLRLTTGAALTARPQAEPRQLHRVTRLAEGLLDRRLRRVSDIWTGVRPCMPDMLPVVGQSRLEPGLWFHFGHGHQGLTLAATTARLLAGDLLQRNDHDVRATALSPDRFDRRV